MKGIYVVQRKHGSAVYVSYMAPGRGQVREHVETVPNGAGFAGRLREAKARARDVRVKRLAAVVEDRFDLPRSRRAMTFARFVELHYGPELRSRGLRGLEMELERLTTAALGQFFGPLMLSQVDEWQVRKFVKGRRDGTVGGRGVGPATINRDLARLSNLWNFAARMKLVSGLNPCREVGKLKEPRGRVRYLTDDEERGLLAHLRPDVRRIAEVALHTGIRLGALLALQWRHVRFAEELIDVPEELDKTGRGYHVAMNARVLEILRDLATRKAHTEPDSIVFCRRDGSRRKSVRTAFERAVEAAKIVDFRWHDLRHTAASRIVQAGGTLLDAGEHLGHRTPSMTQRYAHLSPDRKRRIADLTLPAPEGSITDLSRERDRRSGERGSK